MKVEAIYSLLTAIGCGLLIGIERKIHHKNSGLKTTMLVAMGACAYVLVGRELAGSSAERIIANIITGVGFLGAGTIVKGTNDRVSGLTTASLIWCVAAVGLAAGLGQFQYAFLFTALSLLITYGSRFIENKFFKSKGEG